MELTRRALIVRGGMASGALALGAASAVATSPKAHKAKIVVTGGHPGDPEYGCGGTIATLTEEGHEVVLLYLSDGAWPPSPSETRLAEAKRACELLGARPSYAGQRNGAAIVDNSHYEDFAKRLDDEAPDAVFTHVMVDNHRDHRAIAMLSYDARKKAAFYAHASQTPDRYYELQDRVARFRGLESGCMRAEAFVWQQQSPFD